MGSGRLYGRTGCQLNTLPGLDEMIEVSSGYSIPIILKSSKPCIPFEELAFNESPWRNGCVIGRRRTHVMMTIYIMNSHGITVFIDAGLETILERLSGKIRLRPCSAKSAWAVAEYIKEIWFRRIFYDQASSGSVGGTIWKRWWRKF